MQKDKLTSWKHLGQSCTKSISTYNMNKIRYVWENAWCILPTDLQYLNNILVSVKLTWTTGSSLSNTLATFEDLKLIELI